ncbi:MAG: TIGR01212 family radical SAM protein [Bacteroidia bacterium]|nr:TIGR01212 family radical SAM protein [Bacteroidia bacterium]
MEKRYNSYVGYFREKYGRRLQKLVIDAGFSCPNRDGTVGGCSYCDNAAFHPGYSTPGKSIAQQLDEGIEFHKVRYRNASSYLAYFQAYSNTYGPVAKLRSAYSEALSHPEVAGIVIGTRPDCIDEEKLDLLEELRDTPQPELPDGSPRPFATPIVQIEYGIESCYDTTLQHIGRGHDFECAVKAVEMTAARGFDVGAHFILGLPSETREMLLDQCSLINSLPLHSVKFHQLQLVKGTRMEAEAKAYPERFLDWDLDEYLDLIVDILERLRPDLYIERVAGEVPPRFVEKTRWGLIRNFQILHLLDERLEQRDTFQGARFRL